MESVNLERPIDPLRSAPQPIATPISSSLEHTVVNKPVAKENTTAEKNTPEKHSLGSTPKVRKKKNWRAWAFAAMGMIVFGLGVAVSIQTFMTNKAAEKQVLAVTSPEKKKERIELPHEEQPPKDQLKTYQVAPDIPRIISIPSLGVKARVLSLGVDGSNRMETPKGIFDAGWYNGSAKPGESGATLISGHVSGPTMHGVFYDIKKLKDGDVISIEKGNSTKTEYVVKKIDKINADKVDMAKLLVSVDPSKSGLNLITCGGKFDPATNHFEDRTLVYAVLR